MMENGFCGRAKVHWDAAGRAIILLPFGHWSRVAVQGYFCPILSAPATGSGSLRAGDRRRFVDMLKARLTFPLLARSRLYFDHDHHHLFRFTFAPFKSQDSLIGVE